MSASNVSAQQSSVTNWQSQMWLGITPGASAITLRVMSSGCTKKEDFSFSITDEPMISVTRVRADKCRAMPKPIEFHYSFIELGISDTVYFNIEKP